MKGTDMFNDTVVLVGGIRAMNVTMNSTRLITFLTPAQQTTGYFDMTIINPDGGFFTLANEMYYTDDCPFPGQFGKGLECKPCPEGGVCPGGYRIWPKQGYWNNDEASGFVYKCKEPSGERRRRNELLKCSDRCLGGRESACKEGYANSFCDSCANEFYIDHGECLSCDTDSGIAVALIMAGKLSVPLVFLILSSFFLVFFSSLLLFCSVLTLQTSSFWASSWSQPSCVLQNSLAKWCLCCLAFR